MDFVVRIGTLNVKVDVDMCPPTPPWRLMTFGPVREQNLPGLEKGEPMNASLTNTQEVDITYPKPVDKKGQPAPVQDGSVKFSSSDETAATVTQDPADPFKATVRSVGAGVTSVNIEADADMGDGTTLIHGEPISFQISGGQAVGFGSPTIGTPREQV